jgi:hypothetical protein
VKEKEGRKERGREVGRERRREKGRKEKEREETCGAMPGVTKKSTSNAPGISFFNSL